MKFAVRSVGILFALSLGPIAACEVHEPDLAIVQSMCTRIGVGDDGLLYDFQPVSPPPTPTDVRLPMGSFEGSFYIPAGALIVDDDDLTDDYDNYLKGRALAEERLSGLQSQVEIYENIDPLATPTAEQTDAMAAIDAFLGDLLVYCERILEPGFAPTPGDEISDLEFITFTACKDKYDASGDGIVATFDLADPARPGYRSQDGELANCITASGGDNQMALNFWGPLSTKESEIEGLVPTPRDGFTYSGITIPLFIGDYRETADISQWEGIAFWARLANANEAVPIQDTPSGRPPLAGGEIPEGARPQDGVGQLGVIIQTIDTAAVLANGLVDGMGLIRVCNDMELATYAQWEAATPDVEKPFCFKTQAEFDAFPGQVASDGFKYAYMDAQRNPQTPEFPFCEDYSPVDAVVGQEAPYRDQCWDGFRSMLDISTDWKFYFMPFSEMRQAGWGRVAKSFRLDQVRSVNFLTSAFQPVNVMVDEVSYYRRRP